MQQSDSRSTFVILVAETWWFLGRCSLFETNRRSTRNLWLSYALLLTINKEKNILKGSMPVTSSRESLGLKTVPFLFLRLSSFGWVVVFGSFFKLIATLLRLLSREGNFAELNLHLSVLRTCRSFLSYPFSFFFFYIITRRERNSRGARPCANATKTSQIERTNFSSITLDAWNIEIDTVMTERIVTRVIFRSRSLVSMIQLFTSLF